ncbi:MAG: cobalamin B12-binding domain-containing protein [Bacillota bacterium]|jgi:methylmalonyl-CoA mutase C-terminal domain/subunit|nr:cobalamin B12-binding domain-containing protein [Candidatus Fermentithermobacillaceae bacterium]HAF66673.1 methylmalonyl-CoA mutase [Clostridiales bacterium UBA9857]HOA70982.1 cobalamin B12-binding domain-containing protein [Bacillota bacterium]HOP71423.1 cobalamin B12-binding domain-containing protein [Bacillota bacterium]HPT36246.1 cobalamin B12-binding domain-containing protein [Bacillota bacterium]
MERKIRVLVGKPGLDGHDRGAKVIARSFRDAGMEVIYSGLHRTPEELARMAVEEDVDVVACSILSGAHNTLLPRVVECLKKEKGTDELDVLVLAGGIIPAEDVEFLKQNGVDEVFGPGTSTQEIVEYTKANLKR